MKLRASDWSIANRDREKCKENAAINAGLQLRMKRRRVSSAGRGPRVFWKIHHIGSTAISGIEAKPVIDLPAVAPDVATLDLAYRVGGELKHSRGSPLSRHRRPI